MKKKELLAEFTGTTLLLTANAGSAAAAQELTNNSAIRGIVNGLSTGIALGLLIFLFSQISGAHFNPAVSIVEFARKRISTSQLFGYLAAQFSGAIFGVVLANLMYQASIFKLSTNERSGSGIYLGEIIATSGLLFVINILRIQKRGEFTPVAVAAWIISAFFFTSSTALANPAVTVARIWADNISGVAPKSILGLILSQLLGAALATIYVEQFKKSKKKIEKND